MKCISNCVALVILGTTACAFAGNIAGVTKQLNGELVPDVQIRVIDLDNGAQVLARKSDGKGVFNIPLPDGLHVSIQFTERNHLPAALVGISGSVQLTNFDIFLPALYKKEIEPSNNCCCCARHRLRHCAR